MPSILIETGCLTNPKEEDFLHSEKGQDYLASAIFRAFRTYKESVEAVETSIIQKKEKIKIIKKEEKNITEKKEIIEVKEKVIYKVQIGTYLKSMLSNKLFQEIKAKEQIFNDTYKYFVGGNNSKIEATKTKILMQKKGFKGAFVVAFYKGNKISTKDALNLQKKIKNHE